MAANKKNESGDIVSPDNKPAALDLKDTTPGVKIDDSVLITVKSNVFGRLIYKNSKTGDIIEWNGCEDAQEMTMGDLRAMKATQTAFYRNQWVVITGVSPSGSECSAKPADIYKALGITKYYENLVEPSDFNGINAWTEKEIGEKVSLMTPGARENLIVALNEYIKKGVLDSIKKIKAFEKALGCELADGAVARTVS